MMRQACTYLPGVIDPDHGFALDMSGMPLDAALLCELTNDRDATPKEAALEKSDGLKPDLRGPLARAHDEMKRIEDGLEKNQDEGRAVTHFTDRKGYLSSEVYEAVETFAKAVRTGEIPTIDAVIVNGIGGSALGPQLLQFAIRGPYWNELSADARDGCPAMYFLDNIDAAGIADVTAAVDLSRALVVTISKSGGTKETYSNMRALEQAYGAAGIPFAAHAVAVTMEGSKLWEYADANGWLQLFPMAESIGGRTSETNIVGHVPAALAGIDFAAFVRGARAMDEMTSVANVTANPAYQLACAWHVAGNGRGDRNMVVVPYSDRLVLFGKYLQQLVMESLGKKLDRDGNVVHQGLTVYGNKGGTDAHAYIQQLNDGRNDFFATFIEVLEDAEQVTIEDGLMLGDYLHAFQQGLVNALISKGRPVINIVIDRLDEASLGMLIALYERAVAVYAELININAFHQPGVQAYKLASGKINDVNAALQAWLSTQQPGAWRGTAAEAAEAAGCPGDAGAVEGILAKFAVNARRFGAVTVTRSWDQGWQFALV